MFILECRQKIVGNADRLIQWHRAEQSWGCLDQWEIPKKKSKKKFYLNKFFGRCFEATGRKHDQLCHLKSPDSISGARTNKEQNQIQ
jgi:hypothetical protein